MLVHCIYMHMCTHIQIQLEGHKNKNTLGKWWREFLCAMDCIKTMYALASIQHVCDKITSTSGITVNSSSDEALSMLYPYRITLPYATFLTYRAHFNTNLRRSQEPLIPVIWQEESHLRFERKVLMQKITMQSLWGGDFPCRHSVFADMCVCVWGGDRWIAKRAVSTQVFFSPAILRNTIFSSNNMKKLQAS